MISDAEIERASRAVIAEFPVIMEAVSEGSEVARQELIGIALELKKLCEVARQKTAD